MTGILLLALVSRLLCRSPICWFAAASLYVTKAQTRRPLYCLILGIDLIFGSGAIGQLNVVCLIRTRISLEPVRVLGTQLTHLVEGERLVVEVVKLAQAQLHPP
jgi:hypothetical protein